MAVNTEKKLEVLKQFIVQWDHLSDLAFKARQKTAVISKEDDARYKLTRGKILPIYTNMKAVFGRSIDPSEHALNVLNRISSLKQLTEMPEADKNILYHRFEVVGENIRELGEEMSPGSMGVKASRALPITAAAALEEGPKYSVSKEDVEESRRRSRPRTFGAMWSKLMMDPADLFEHQDRDHGIDKPVAFIFKLFLLIGLIMLLCSLFLFRQTILTTDMARIFKNLTGKTSEIVLYIAVWVAVYLVITTVALFVILLTSGWSHVCMKIVGGKGRYDHNYGVHCYTYAPHVFTPLYLILPVLIIVPVVYQFILRVLAGAKVHRISYGKSLLGRLLVLVPYLVIVILLAQLEYRDHWNARVAREPTGICTTDAAMNIFKILPLFENQPVQVEKHLPEGMVHVRTHYQGREIEGRMEEASLRYPPISFYGFVRTEMDHLPVRVSQFSSRLNIRILGNRNETQPK